MVRSSASVPNLRLPTNTGKIALVATALLIPFVSNTRTRTLLDLELLQFYRKGLSTDSFDIMTFPLSTYGFPFPLFYDIYTTFPQRCVTII